MGIDKSPDAFRTISEVAEWLGVQAHVLRFWESKFTQVKPVKRAGGRRYYRPNDMRLLGGIKKLLHDDGLTIKGVQKILREQGINHVAGFSQGLDQHAGAGDVLMVSNTDGMTIDGTLSDAIVSEPGPAEMDVGDDIEPGDVEEPSLEPVALADVGLEKPEAEPDAPLPSEPEPEPVDVSADSIPLFVHQKSREAAKEPEVAPPEPVAAPRPLSVDAPDPPPETDIPHVDGALAHLARIDRLTLSQIAGIAPLAAQLRDLADRPIRSGTA